MLNRLGILEIKGHSSFLEKGPEPRQDGLVSYPADLGLSLSLDGRRVNGHSYKLLSF
jgi:hypothetical protein